MLQDLSYKFALKIVRVLYEDQNFNIQEKTPGQSVTAEFAQDVKDCKLGSLFAFIDEFIFILRYQCYYLTGCVAIDKNVECLMHLRFCTGMLSTLVAIRALSGMGHDLGARTLLRYYYELAILWSRLHFDEVAKNEFALAEINDTNKYWRKFLSRKKSEKFLFENAAAGKIDWIGAAAQDHIDDIYEKLSISGHPGFWGLYFNLSEDFGTFKESIIGRGPDNASLFTLSSAILLTTLPFGANGVTDWNYQCPTLFDATKINPPYRHNIGWKSYCHKLREMILGLFLFSTRFSTELGGGKWI